MKINTALILCAGIGSRLKPLTLKIPKPLLELNDVTMLENCINLIIKLQIKKVLINTFYLGDQIIDFIKNKNFPIEIEIIEDGEEILDTGGGISNMIKNSNDSDYLIFNPDTLWSKNYIYEIIEMQNFYFTNKLNNILLLVNKDQSFDKNLFGDFELVKNSIQKESNNNFIFTGCQILSKNLFKQYKVKNFSILEIWNKLLNKKELNGYESVNNFYHLTNLEIFKKLKDL